ncbi:MAG: methylated-DNA--[protein]-cysteine S-methyltransferase [candidate division KSB1 bacterium]|jgi:methylated-DNA-[protein]-cysteine S-methyltransferase|nr:methylated-DNA--[protein]-cysteine S-methyltransferase [candidate division KSB1 bacterium]
MDDYRIVLVLKNEIEAQLLASVLRERNIPHLLKSYHDYALDGIFQIQKGWGHLEAPERHHRKIINIYRDISETNFGQPFHDTFDTRFGSMGIVWFGADTSLQIHEIVLPGDEDGTVARIHKHYPASQSGRSGIISGLEDKIQKNLQGKAVHFDLDLFNLEICTTFQKRVLLAEYEIPRGSVSTYGRIARFLDKPGASRAVGGALANNPFPIVIACHRAVQSDGSLGGYQGGVEMKMQLLEMEGLTIRNDRVIVDRFYYD